MGFLGRLMISVGAGTALFALVLALGGADFFIDDFYTFTGLAALTIYILDYLNYWLAT